MKLLNEQLDFIVTPQLFFNKQIGDSKLLWQKISRSTSDLVSFLDNRTQWQTAGATFKKEFLEKIQWTEGLSSWQDWDFFIRVLNKKPHYIHYEKELPDVFIRRADKQRISLQYEYNKGVLEERVRTFENLKTHLNNHTYSQVLNTSIVSYLIGTFEKDRRLPISLLKEMIKKVSGYKKRSWVVIHIILFRMPLIKSLSYRLIRKRILGVVDINMKEMSEEMFEKLKFRLNE